MVYKYEALKPSNAYWGLVKPLRPKNTGLELYATFGADEDVGG